MTVSSRLIKRLLIPFIAGFALISGLAVVSGHFFVADASMARVSNHLAVTQGAIQTEPHLLNEHHANQTLTPPAPPASAMVEPIDAQQDPLVVAGAIKPEDYTSENYTSENYTSEGHGLKSLAIDSETGVGVEPNVSQLSPVQLAAQIWSSASFPVEQFQSYTSPFGYRTSPSGGYRQEFHYGLDIAAPQSSYIRNWWAGKVLEVSDGGNCGTSIVIQSGEWIHVYCHMQGHVAWSDGSPYLIDREGGVQIWQGQDVFAGDRIGRVGMTGRTTGPHLHWGLKYQGHWVDPAWVLQAMVASHHALYGQ